MFNSIDKMIAFLSVYPTREQLNNMKKKGVTPTFVEKISNYLGQYATPEQYIELYEKGVTPTFVEKISNHLGQYATPEQYIELYEKGVTPTFVQKISNHLGQYATPTQFIELYEKGVTPTFVEKISNNLGQYATPAQFIELYEKGVTSTFVEKISDHLGQYATPEQFIELYEKGVTPTFVEKISNHLGRYATPEQFIELYEKGVTSTFVEKISDHLGNYATPAQLIELKKKGATPAFIENNFNRHGLIATVQDVLRELQGKIINNSQLSFIEKSEILSEEKNFKTYNIKKDYSNTGGDIFEVSVASIENFYKKYNYTLGWRFLNSSKKTLFNNPLIALITLNPGGNKIPPDHAWESCEKGSSYLHEIWGSGSIPGQSNLQQQIQLMFQRIIDKSNFSIDRNSLIEQSLCGYFVPFRSPRRSDLPHKKAAFEFAERLWINILTQVKPKLFICIDPDTHKHIRSIIPKIYGINIVDTQLFQTNWGNVTATLDKFGTNSRINLLKLPHLSTFKLFSSVNCQNQLDLIFKEACKVLI